MSIFHVVRSYSLWLLLTLSLQALASTRVWTTSNNNTYVYEFIPPQNSQSTVLFLHGFPSSRIDWSQQIHDLATAGFGVLAPDMLGYGDSDKPIDPSRYNFKFLSQDLDSIMEHEELDNVVGVGHDWGSSVLSATVVWYPQRFEKLAFLSVGYSPPGFYDVDATNAESLRDFGYTSSGYWYFFNSYDAESVMRKNIVSCWNLLFPVNTSVWRDHLASIDSARTWLNHNYTTDLPTWRNETDKTAWIRHYDKEGAFDASLNLYRAAMRGVQAVDGITLTEEEKLLKVPVLAVTGSQDMVARTEYMQPATKPWSSNGYTELSLDAGHWLMLEKASELSSILMDFVFPQ